MIYEGCIQLTAVLILLQLTGRLLALVRESILPFPSLPSTGRMHQQGAQAGLEKGSSNTWGSQVQPVPFSQCDLPQNLWAALLRGRKLDIWDIWDIRDIWVFQEFYLKHCKGLLGYKWRHLWGIQSDSPCEARKILERGSAWKT